MVPLATYEQLQLHLGRTLDEDIATQALTLSSGAVRSYCRWVISYTEDDALQTRGVGSKVLTLPTVHLLDVTSINVDGTDLPPVWGPDLKFSRSGQIYRTEGWCKDALVNVTVNHGYTAADMPDAITLVVLDGAARQMTNPESLVSATVGEVQRTWSSTSAPSSALTPLHQALLDNYRLYY